MYTTITIIAQSTHLYYEKENSCGKALYIISAHGEENKKEESERKEKNKK